ncbi:OVARIAN TUMOR DOMAIN-containing deubiquitinating enzyme 9 isoform X2 [Ricinus communis]|uniref:OVARIAN TUMOR DOMAIN-containing deubiquitinating enzyme 9 isoform X2 n=1 Tax=Ricinus communis TaxID=3988 RepID=UPI00201B31AB|nr:OVARIAN TUMOR DOMAIN-containing deubiquitinating enzyme 9 isoform X2 [Ricinus communis]
MIVHEQDPDVVRWGLHTLIDVCAPHSGPCNSVTHYGTSECQVGYVIEGYNEDANNVENDAVIARALQEELSRIDAAEASGFHNTGQESILAQNWVASPGRSNSSGKDRNEGHSKYNIDADECSKKESDSSSNSRSEDNDAAQVSFSSPNTGEESFRSTGEEFFRVQDLSHLLEIADESTLDGEVGKRLNQMVPVPHVPKINGEIPSEDEVVSDHQRLLDRLKLYDLVESKVQGDGNCQFRALSDQLYRSAEHHKIIRERVISQLKTCPEKYEGYVPMAYGDYLKKMSKTGEWGDHVTLQAAADSYGVKIFVLTSFRDTCYIEILPQTLKSERVIFLSFWAEVHYNSIYPEGELPLPETKKKKRWWMLGS